VAVARAHVGAGAAATWRGVSAQLHTSAAALGIDYRSYLSRQSRLREPSPIRALQPLVKLPGMISLGGGMPNPDTFPIKGMSITLDDGTELHLTPDEVTSALQYSPTEGLPDLVQIMHGFQVDEHCPPPAARESFKVTLSTGSQESLARTFAMLLNPEDTLLLEEPTYSGSLAFLKPHGCNLVGIATDAGGMIPESLAHTLASWREAHPDRAKPKVLYVIPTGANPSGGTLSEERRHQVYAIAQEHDLLIIEDDPYYYLQFAATRASSLLKLDVDGRVIRFDSFSKILSSGMRTGLVSGPAALVEQLNLHTQAVNLHPSGISQAVLLKLMQHWGAEGFARQVANVCAFYLGQRDAFLQAADTHLTGLAEWTKPEAGMFSWIKLYGVDDSFQLIGEKAKEEKVLLVPGQVFIPSGGKSSYVRAAYSTATPEEMDLALERLARIITSA